MWSKLFNFVCLSAGLLLISGCSERHIQLKTAITQALNQAHQQREFNGVALVEYQNDVIILDALGSADGSEELQLTTGAAFALGSITKEFNAVALMMLVESGELHLDDSLSQYFVHLPGWAQKVRIRHLLNYTSGLPRVKFPAIKEPADVDKQLLQIDALAFEPGLGYLYSNHNVFLQIRLIEKLSGLSYREFLTRRILKPLNMSKTFLNNETPAHLATAFNSQRKPDPIMPFPIEAMVHSTAEDMLKWLRALDGERLISMKSMQVLTQGYDEESNSALGFGIIRDGNWVVHRHHGSNFNFESQVYFNKELGIRVVLLTNNKMRQLNKLNHSIEQLIKELG